MDNHYECITRSGNRPAAGAQITVRKDGALATIYSDDGVTVQANPITAGSDGCFEFFAVDGVYEVTLSGNGIVTKTYRVTLSSGKTEFAPTFAQISNSTVARLIVVAADETNGGARTLYAHNGVSLCWVPTQEV